MISAKVTHKNNSSNILALSIDKTHMQQQPTHADILKQRVFFFTSSTSSGVSYLIYVNQIRHLKW